MTTVTPDEVVLAGYFDLSLTGLESLKFTEISGLNHSVGIQSASVATQGAGHADMRTVTTPQAVSLTMQHVVLVGEDIWTWLNDSISGAPTAKKSGTLSMRSLGKGEIQKTWTLDDVYLTGLTLDAMGAGAAANLTASLTLLVGQCKPS